MPFWNEVVWHQHFPCLLLISSILSLYKELKKKKKLSENPKEDAGHLSLFFPFSCFFVILEHIKVRSDMQCPGALSNMLLGLENFIFYLMMIT